jgi:hypothetical protein
MAKCPNINSDEWKVLVDIVGELEAYAVYVENGYEIPSKEGIAELDKVEWYPELEREAEYIQQVTKVRANILNTLKTKYNLYKSSDSKYIDNLKKLIKDFQDADVETTLFKFIRNAESNLKMLSERMAKEKGNLKLLNQLNSFAGIYNMVPDVTAILNSIPEKHKTGKEKGYNIIEKRLSDIAGTMKTFNSSYIKFAIDALETRLSSESTIARGEFKRKAEIKYEEDFPRNKSSLSPKEYNEKKAKYVKTQLNNSKDAIYAAEKRYIRKLLKTAPKDISSITKALIDPRGVNDHIIQIAVKMLDNADYKTKEEFVESRGEAVKKWESFISGKRELITDQKKLYDGIIEKINGNETNWYVRPMYSTFYDAKSEAYKEYYKLREQGDKNPDKPVEVFKAKYTVNPDKKKGIFDPENIKPEYRNPQWETLQKNPEKKEVYDFLLMYNNESDKMVSGSMVLGYKLPSITKANTELITDRKGLKGVKEIALGAVAMRGDDYLYGDLENQDGKIRVLTDQKGEMLKRVSVPFRTDIDVKDQSFDLFGMALSNRYISLNYKNKNIIKDDLEVVKDVLAERELIVRKNGKAVLKTAKKVFGADDEEVTDIERTVQGDQSESYKLLLGIMEDRLYGKSNVAHMIGTVSLDKVSNLTMKIAADNMLIGNLMGGTSNLLNGKVMNFFESTRKNLWGRKDLISAEAKYISDLANVVKDYERLVPNSKTNLLLEKFFDTAIDFSGAINKLSNDTRFKRIFNTKTLHGINSSAEHYIQSTLMYAALNNTKVQNQFGKYIDKNGKTVSDRKDAAPVDEMYIIENGKLKWKDSSYVIEGFDSLDKNAEFTVSRKIKDAAQDLHGNYDSKNKAQIQRYWYGKQLMFLRKWMLPGIQRRWRGFETAFKKWDDVEAHEKFYSEAAQDYKEGTYVSAIRYITSIFKYGRELEMAVLTKEWNSLSDMEKGNIKAAASELSIMVGALAASSLLAGLAEGAEGEEEEEFLYANAYIMRRIYGELLTYTPLGLSGEGLRTLQTPAATMSLIELSMRALGQLTSDIFNGFDFEEYQSGKHKGESKSFVLWNKILNPISKNLVDRDAKKSFEYLTNMR